MSKINDLPIEILIFLGWLTATLPVKSPIKSFRNQQFQLLSFSTLFVAVGFIYMAVYASDMLHVVGFKFFVDHEIASAGSRSAETIISAIMWITQHSTIQINRLNFAFHCSLLVQILKSLGEAESTILKIKQHVSLPGRRRVDGSLHWILFALMTFLMTWSGILFTTAFQKFYTDHNMRQLWTVPNNRLVNQILGTLIDMGTVAQYLFVAGTFVAVGMRITNGILDCSYVLEMLCTISSFGSKEYGIAELLNELQDSLRKLRFCYKNLEKVFGLPVLVLTFNMTLNVVAFLYGAEYDGATFAFTGVTSSLLIIFIFAHFGHDAEEALIAAQETLIEASALSDGLMFKVAPFKKATKLVKWFQYLKWKMTARGVYPINHEMIPVLLSMGLTYIVFIFQLRAS